MLCFDVYSKLKRSINTMSRFLTASYDWFLFRDKRVGRFQDDPDSQLREEDVSALDDTFHGKELAF
ncbi:hypothetical protein [Desulfosporosinus nitroreducens]|uniref:hypothetical protein n=1 Tax=Desulfosporosinus nitroreducens TaxID=2018668 RepID=UPI00207C546C|nr:hypothetical protein [Desulfosporosinus nitroreducens]MCO1604459.1 hypothetical protein [Desulfosporosinus nitroreducens]